MSLEDRAIGAYWGLAVGDALGATVEFMTPREIEVEHGCHDEIVGGGWLNLKPGHVTDDTTMSLALGAAILEQGAVDAHAAARAFDGWMRSKPVDIGNTVRRGIIHFRRTGEPHAPVSEHAAGNGACMRCLPVALATFNSQADYRAANRAQAHVTHNNQLSDAATECVIAMIHGAFMSHPLERLRQESVEALLAGYAQFKYDGRRADAPTGYIVDTLQAVFQALFSNDGFEAAMIDVVNRGGDADTTGAILGMIAGACYGSRAIPDRWLKKLDKKVKRHCRDQALALLRVDG